MQVYGSAMSDDEVSTLVARLEKAVARLETDAEALARRIDGSGAPTGDHRLRTEVTAVIDELSAMIGEPRG